MEDPLYDANVTVGGTDSTYQFNAFPNPPQNIAGLSGLLSLQSFILQLTMRDETGAAQYDISGSTATLFVAAANDPDFAPVLLGAGVLTDSGDFGGGITDRVTFTVAKNQIPNDLGAYGKTRAGNSKFFVILEDVDTYLEFFEGVNVYDTQFGGSGGATPGAILINSNNLGVVISTLNTPPVSPNTNDAYLVGTVPTGDWLTPVDLSNNLVIWNGAGWIATAPIEGDFLYDANEDEQKRWNGAAWIIEDAKPFSDSGAMFHNDADSSKELSYDLSGITTATNRTITAADQNIDMTPGTGSYATAAEGDLAATALQDVVDDITPQAGGTFDMNSKQMRWAKGADVVSAAALTLGTDGNYFDITGTTTITSIAALAIGTVVRLHFDGILTLTHNATDLVLPGGANITTAAGDEFTFVEYATGDWRCVAYALASGKAIVGDGGITAEEAAAGTDNNQTGTAYTLVLTDADNKTVWMNNAAANVVTVPTNASVAFPTGTKLPVMQEGAGVTTVTGDTGVTVNGTSAGSKVVSTQYGGVVLQKRGTNTWIVTG